MKVLRLQVHNILRISDVDLSMEGHHLVLVGGKNGQGKTSAIKALLMALCGKRGMDFPDVALREGEDHGWVKVDLSGDESMADLQGFSIELGFRRRRGGKIEESFRLMDSTGEEAPQPRKLLDDLYRIRAFDPLSFEKAKPKEQAEMIRHLLGLDFEELDAEYAEKFSERTVVNRDIKSLESQRAAVKVPAGAPTEKVVVSELLKELDAANTYNKNVDAEKLIESNLRTKLEKQKELVAELEAKLAAAKEELPVIEQSLAGKSAAVSQMDKRDTDSIRKKIDEAESLNAAFELKQKATELDKKLRDTVRKADDLTDRLEAIKSEKQESMENAKWPVPGMAIDADGVTLGGLPFAQASRAERIRTSVEVAMAMNPTLRLMVSENGSDCDSDTLAYLEKVCEERDYQLIMEFVTRSKDDEELCAVVFEDGHAKA